MLVIDCSVHSTPYIPCLSTKRVDVVFRYYARAKQGGGLAEKILEPDEAKALSRARIAIGVVYQYNARAKEVFNFAQGQADCAFARKYAAETIKQPPGSAIYFGVDYDPNPDPGHDPKKHELEANIVPHFQGIVAAMKEAQSYPVYDIGVYGGWSVCNRLSKAKLVKYTWLAQSVGWGGREDRKKYVQSKAWDLMQSMPKHDLCPGLEYDLDTVKDNLQSVGQFTVPVA